VYDVQQAGTAVGGWRVEDMEFGRRLAVERELEAEGLAGAVTGVGVVGKDVIKARSVRSMSIVWDESGSFVIYPTLLGIKGAFLSPFNSAYD
jgi:peptidylprolyl isomerase domain and WD repeat-containing protein 1